MPSIADILIEQGRVLSDARRRRGERAGEIVTSLGQIPATIVNLRQQEQVRAEAARRAATQDEAQRAQIDESRQRMQLLSDRVHQEAQLSDVLEQEGVIDPTTQQFNLDAALTHAKRLGYTGLAQQLAEAAQKQNASVAKETPKPLVVNPGDTVLDPTTHQPLYTAPPKPDKEANPTEALLAMKAAQGDAQAASALEKLRAMRAPQPAPMSEYQRQELDLKRGEDTAVNLTPSGLDQAAQRYLKDGTLPPMGIGKQGAALRTKILNRAAELDPNADIAANKAGYRADSTSLAALQKQRDAITSFENTAGKNIDIFLEQAKHVADTGSPLLNRPVRALTGKVLGSPNQAAYDAARLVAINEVAKITSNPNLTGQLSDAARKEVAEFNPNTATLKQTIAVFKVLRQDMKNRAASMDDTLADIKKRMGGKSAPANETPEQRAKRLYDELTK